jgi:hypothetical protein
MVFQQVGVFRWSFAPGYGGTPLTHTPTAEYLASHGYVVAMSPSQDESPAGMTFDVCVARITVPESGCSH